MKVISGSKFNFESVKLMDYKLHKVSLKRGASYIESPEWLLYKGATTNPKNENADECLRLSITSALNYNEIKKKEKTYLKKLNKKIKIFHHTIETGKILNKTMSQLLLISYLNRKIVKK